MGDIVQFPSRGADQSFVLHTEEQIAAGKIMISKNLAFFPHPPHLILRVRAHGVRQFEDLVKFFTKESINVQFP